MKITLISEPNDRAILEAWLEENRPDLEYISDNDGCGCCVDIYCITGPSALLSSVPDELSGGSSWDHSSADVRTFEEHKANEAKAQLLKAEQEQLQRELEDAHDAFRQKQYRRYIERMDKLPDRLLGPLELKRISIAKRKLIEG